MDLTFFGNEKEIPCSTIDHFILSPRLMNNIVSCGAVHKGDNLSRHSPIILKVKIDGIQFSDVTNSSSPRCLPAWEVSKESERLDYQILLREKLSKIQCPVSISNCKMTQCSDISHVTECDNFVLDMILSTVESSFLTIPLTGRIPRKRWKKRRKIIPGWTQHVDPYRRYSQQCYRALLLAGGPDHGPIFEEKQRSNAQY